MYSTFMNNCTAFIKSFLFRVNCLFTLKKFIPNRFFQHTNTCPFILLIYFLISKRFCKKKRKKKKLNYDKQNKICRQKINTYLGY